MIKLNKNQKAFFQEAVKYFGNDSYNIRMKDLKIFANENDLTVPVSALNKYCKEEGLGRGKYNITLSGYEVDNRENNKEKEYSVDIPKNNEVKENKITSKKEINKKETIKKELNFRNPVYCVFLMDHDEYILFNVSDNPSTAYNKAIGILNDHGNKNENEVYDALKYEGQVFIRSNNSALVSFIQVKEMNQ